MNSRMEEKNEPVAEAVVKYVGEDGVTAEVKESQQNFKGCFTCNTCGATVRYDLKGVTYKSVPRFDGRGDTYDADVFNVKCPVPYCGTVGEVSGLPTWAKLIVKSKLSTPPYR